MSRKKETDTLISPEDTTQVHHLLAHYHQIAQDLHNSSNQDEVEGALTGITTLSESAQLAFLKALSKENSTDAADILAAMNALSQHKEIRKEARRSLIRLEATRTYPQWTPPIARTPAVSVNIANPPRFWKGVVTQVREGGEIQLGLFWEQGYDYSETRSLVFLLDFWRDGVKDVVVETSGKRRIEERITEMRTKFVDVPITDCTLAEGKRLIEEALSVNAWRGTAPNKDYRNNQAIINQLVMQATDLGEDRGRTFINPELEDQEVVVNFLGAWSMGDYGLTYDLLTEGSSNRENLSRDEWIERHRAWADEAHPARLQLGFVHEREQSQTGLWLPAPVFGGRLSTRKEIEVGWSLELADTPLSATLREMPMGTAINKDTGRHWFWTSYTLVHGQDGWRIQSISDDGARIQGLSITELQKHIQEDEQAIDAKFAQRGIGNTDEILQELNWRLVQLLHYYDALIARLPLDRKVCDDAYRRSLVMGNPERVLVYLDRLAQRFPEYKAETLRRLGATLVSLAYSYSRQGLSERRERLLQRAETTLRESLTFDDSATGHMLLGELFSSENRNDEAEAEFLLAKTKTPTLEEEASIEAGLAIIDMRRERMEEAIAHYRRVADIDPDYPGIWFSLGFAHRLLAHIDEAEASYIRALEVDPQDARVYSELVAIYMNRQQKAQARAIAEQGVRDNPDSAALHALFASVLFELGDVRGARQQIKEAEELDPELEIVQDVRQHIDKARKR
jgi:tetratricopeptide (TPR) repeat protein